MAAADWSDVVPLLRCPSCQRALPSVQPVCEGHGCPRNGESLRVVGVPVLVNWANSIIGAEDVARVTSFADEPPKPNGLVGSLRRLASTPTTTSTNVMGQLLEQLTSSRRRFPIVLIIGGGSAGNGTGILYSSPDVRVVAFDVYPSRLTHFVGDAHDIPLADGSVDAVIAQAVLEHVIDPARVVSEIHRVLRRDGLALTEIPFMQQVHEGAYDFTRFTPIGHRWLMRGFQELDHGPLTGPGESLRWAVDYYTRALTRRTSYGYWSRAVTRAALWSERFMSPPHVLDGAGATYFLGRRSDRELPLSQIVAQYKGAQGRPAREWSGSRNGRRNAE